MAFSASIARVLFRMLFFVLQVLWWASRFWRDKALGGPVLVVSVATFGGSLHAPVVAFFYLQVLISRQAKCRRTASFDLS